MLPYARRAAAGAGLPVSVVLAQWAVETGWGGSKLAMQNNNLGGIEFRPGLKAAGYQSYSADGRFAGYNSVDQFVNDYIRLWQIQGYGYPAARAAAAATYSSPAARAAAVARAVGLSGYDAGGYKWNGSEPGSSLIRVIEQNRLTQFDGPAPAAPVGRPSAPPGPEQALVGLLAAGALVVLVAWLLGGLVRFVREG